MNKIITIRSPGTTANLGVLFDSGAMAINELYTDVTFSPNDSDTIITVSGYGKNIIPTNEKNVAYQAIKEYEIKTGISLPCFSLHIDNNIPFKGGLGSSAASIIGALVAINEYYNHQLSNEELLSIALKIEKHGDNLLACLLGGFTLFQPNILVNHSIPCELQAVITIPTYHISTYYSRKDLPPNYSKEDAVEALQNAALMTYAILKSDYSIFSTIIENDVIHIPYREKYQKTYREVKLFAKQHQSLGTTISGSGAAIISFVLKSKRQKLFDKLSKTFSDCEVIPISFNNRGATQIK